MKKQYVIALSVLPFLGLSLLSGCARPARPVNTGKPAVKAPVKALSFEQQLDNAFKASQYAQLSSIKSSPLHGGVALATADVSETDSGMDVEVNVIFADGFTLKGDFSRKISDTGETSPYVNSELKIAAPALYMHMNVDSSADQYIYVMVAGTTQSTLTPNKSAPTPVVGLVFKRNSSNGFDLVYPELVRVPST